jgi:hypothetical protein
VKLAVAWTFQKRMTGRTETDPTRSAATLRAVIHQHSPADVSGRVECACQAAVPYPCPTTELIALELGVPLPTTPTYEEMVDD